MEQECIYHRYCYREDRIVWRRVGIGWWRLGGGDDGGGWRAAAPDTRLYIRRLQIRGEKRAHVVSANILGRASVVRRTSSKTVRAALRLSRVCYLYCARDRGVWEGARFVRNYNLIRFNYINGKFFLVGWLKLNVSK